MRPFATVMGLATLLAASPAVACSIILPADYEGSSQQRRDVRDSIERATIIIDGEVVRPWTPERPALVRVEHVLKGYPPELVEVGGPGAGADCSIPLAHIGERSRMILSNGPSPYDLFRDQSEARHEDRVLHSDRREVWPYFPGIQAAPSN
ncbi:MULTISPECIES: hypothetical protein [unclassified Novosphingobium]|jgi:hypothetical protein|uniref:hypothetical protein n=1 Tax=unclassified Novosphingobium TaxID=2644732 RepID=UPI0025EAB0CD|nr:MULTISPECIES: hypothetical protein [unclassified Novosphingobium]HQV02495.1 hypothetical protein [Novosphingobium sp.]